MKVVGPGFARACDKRSEIESLRFRMERKEKMVLIINRIMAAVANSSVSVALCSLSSFREVRTRKQMPRRLDEALRIWVEVFFSSIYFYSFFNQLI